MDKEEIEKAREHLKTFFDGYTLQDCSVCTEECNKKCEYVNTIETILNYIQQLETKVKELGKGQHSLMQSRRKWKKRYYKERRKVKELEEVDLTTVYLDGVYDGKEHTQCLENKVKVLGKQIAELEEEKQKVIDKLKQEKNTIEMTYSQINGNYFMAQDRLDLINEILEIYNKGDNNETRDMSNM